MTLGYDKRLYLMAFDPTFARVLEAMDPIAGRYRDVIEAYRSAESRSPANDGGSR
jgi:hypothetical protein